MVDIGMRGTHGAIKVRIGHIPKEKDKPNDFELWTLQFKQGDGVINVTSRDRVQFALLISDIMDEAQERGLFVDE
ncbi:hypothetical protein CEE36_11395 [candidate division TA06 bacterium B3_TA06]|uniref:Uncharacterized protein n=1 Tax=candidate division TA06 bacterium B3_TA06 TaxID=2012487 RepID=A0A532UPM9_UNCT6|nr:MAG: hypothetical protein CEE36_11395 [candidate division TA06 bacterium B3_TA06]